MLVLTVILASLVLLIAISVRRMVNYTTKTKPSQPPLWPIIGHLPLLSRSKQPIHRFVSSLSQTYGPIMRLQLGVRPVLFVSSSDLAKECFTTNDKLCSKAFGVQLQNFELCSLRLLLEKHQKNLQPPALHCTQNRILQGSPHRGNFRSHSFPVGEFSARGQSS